MKKEYNKLTKQLLAEGYTVDNHPDYVEVGRCCPSKDNPLDNFDGGFQYHRWWIYDKTFKTPCGLQCKGTSCIPNMSYGGIEWNYENDNPVIHCPYNNAECKQRHELLVQADGVIKDWCNVHLTDEEYTYEGSVEGILKQEDERIQMEKISFALQRNGRVCSQHMHYDKDTKEWKMSYDPCHCARIHCSGQFGKKVEGEKVTCPILGRPLDSKKGNVYYDVKTRFRRYDLDGTLMEGQIDTHIQKGIRFFDRPVSMDICRNAVKLCKDEIIKTIKLNKYHQELFFAEYYGREFSIEILNIRAQERESRDLMQDLQDIKNGIAISYDSDIQKSTKEDKRKRREAAKQKRKEKVEHEILKKGYGNMELFEQNRACKLLGFDRIDELEAIREGSLQKKESKPVQLNLFDMITS